MPQLVKMVSLTFFSNNISVAFRLFSFCLFLSCFYSYLITGQWFYQVTVFAFSATLLENLVTNKDPYKGNKVSTGFAKYMQISNFSRKFYKRNIQCRVMKIKSLQDNREEIISSLNKKPCHLHQGMSCMN